MDVVYLCRDGRNEELRYSLRSLVNIEHDKVWIFGGRPTWHQGLHVAVPQTGTKQENAKRNLLAACLYPGVSSPFLLMNDDFFIVAPATAALFDRGPAREVIAEYEALYPRSSYPANMRRTVAVLEKMGYRDPLSFELHVPMPVRREVMLEAVQLIFQHGHMPLNHRTIYGALSGDTSTRIDDVKVYSAEQPMPGGPWLSSSDGSFKYVRPLLQELFPDPSSYEMPVVGIAYRQEDGVLYTCPTRVERRGVLIAYAGEVMTEDEARKRGLDVSAKPSAPPEKAPEPAEEVTHAPEAPVASPEPAEITVRELKALLNERGVSYEKNARKADLLELAGL